MHSVYGIGTVLVDYYCKCEYSDLEKFNLKKDGCTIVDDKKLFQLLSAFDFSGFSAGGTTANIIREMQALGCKAMFTGTVKGDSKYSKKFVDCLESVGVDVDLVVKSGTGISIVLVMVTPDGKRTLAYKEDNSILLLDDINNSFWHECDIFLTDGNLCDASGTEDTIITLLHQAKKSAFILPIEDVIIRNRHAVLRCIELSNIIFGNIYDYASLFMLSNDLEAIGNYLFEENFKNNNENHDKIYVITNDVIGAVAVSIAGIVFKESEKIDVLIDNTGAGDFFVAGFLKSYLNGTSLEKCLKFGHRIASKNIKQFGTGVIKSEK